MQLLVIYISCVFSKSSSFL